MDEFEALGLEVDKPSRCVLLSPDGVPIRDKDDKEAYIELLSTDSEVARLYDRAMLNQRITRRSKTKAEQLENENNSKLAKLTVGWYLVNPATREPMDVPFSAQAAYRLYSSGRTAWIRDQAWSHADERANFSESSSKTS